MYIDKLNIEKELKAFNEANDKYIELNKKVEEYEKELRELMNKFKEQIKFNETFSYLYKKEKELNYKKELYIFSIYNNLCEVINKKFISFNRLVDFLDDLDIYFDLTDDDLYFEEDDEYYYLTYYCEINCRDFEAFKISKEKLNEFVDILNAKLKEICNKEG